MYTRVYSPHRAIPENYSGVAIRTDGANDPQEESVRLSPLSFPPEPEDNAVESTATAMPEVAEEKPPESAPVMPDEEPADETPVSPFREAPSFFPPPPPATSADTAAGAATETGNPLYAGQEDTATPATETMAPAHLHTPQEFATGDFLLLALAALIVQGENPDSELLLALLFLFLDI